MLGVFIHALLPGHEEILDLTLSQERSCLCLDLQKDLEHLPPARGKISRSELKMEGGRGAAGSEGTGDATQSRLSLI